MELLYLPEKSPSNGIRVVNCTERPFYEGNDGNYTRQSTRPSELQELIWQAFDGDMHDLHHLKYRLPGENCTFDGDCRMESKCVKADSDDENYYICSG